MLIFIVTFNIFPAIVFWSTLQDKTADFECNAGCMERPAAKLKLLMIISTYPQ